MNRKVAKKSAAGARGRDTARKGTTRKRALKVADRPVAARTRSAAVSAKRSTAAAVPDARTIEQFLFHEARLLDERRFEQWRELFTDDGCYWMPTQYDQTSADEVVSVFYDDRSVMASRIKRLRHPDAHIQIPVSHTAHLVGNVEVEPEPDAQGNIVVHAVFLMTEYRRDPPRWLSGRYRYLLVRANGRLRIRMKKVVLINCEAALPAMAVYA